MPNSVAFRERVEGMRVARLATVRPDGRPHIVPICFVLAEGVLYTAVDQKPKRASRLVRLENVEANPRVAVLVDHYDDDWSRLLVDPPRWPGARPVGRLGAHAGARGSCRPISAVRARAALRPGHRGRRRRVAWLGVRRLNLLKGAR